MSDRIFAALWLAFCAAVGWMAWQIEAPISYEPIGPRAYPMLLAGTMAAQTQAAYARSWTRKAALTAATTSEEVEAV